MVDPKRIGSIGHSHGAYETLFAAAFEPRISAAVASCGFTTFRSDPNPERWSHLTALIPQLGCYLPDVASIPFDWQHVLGLTAPRHLFVWYATQDTIFPKTDNLDGLLKDVQKVYRLEGAADALSWQAFQGPHKFPKAGREEAYRWLETAFAPNTAAGGTNAPRGEIASAFFPASLGRPCASQRAHTGVGRRHPRLARRTGKALDRAVGRLPVEPHVRQHATQGVAGMVGRLLPGLQETRADV